MYNLIQHLIAFKYACKIKHWSTNNYAEHLLYDRLSEELDNWVDAISENYFMANQDKSVFKSNILNPKLIQSDLPKMCSTIISLLEELQTNEYNEGINSLLSAIEERFLNKLALANLT